ncbi:substrate-binding periplasmic protein [Vogesella facilis]|uniref:Substrate-binding periplasmic protein n=1 Tax=Vogesella facilis TaxID=1655232 RepID=A0ABV7R8S3_9NEIS
MRVPDRWLLLLAACLPLAAVRAETVLTIATGELPPYVSAQPQDSFLTELLHEVGHRMGVRFRFEFMPWKRCERYVEEKRVWAAIPYVPTPERNQRFYFSAPLYSKRTVFFYYSANGRPKPISYRQLTELQGYNIGAVRGYFYEQMLRDAQLQTSQINNEEQGFSMLRAGRIDLLPAMETAGWYMLGKLFPGERQLFFTVDKPLDVGANYLMTAQDYPDGQRLLQRFNSALQAVKDNGGYQRIARRHGLVLAD